jgi:hypothetical protein
MSVKEVMARVAASKAIGADDALQVRRAIYADGRVDASQMEWLFQIDEAAERRHPGWIALFCEAVVDYLVHQERPSGYVSEANADWLMARIAQDGTVKTETELEALVRVLEAAKESPARLAAFALAQVKAAVVEGSGPLACGRELAPGRIGRAEVDLIRRILYAFGGKGGVAVTRAEAEVLFDINDATSEADNDPAWSDLFVKAVASCVMAASGYQPPSREVALRREAWLDDPSEGVSGMLGRMLAGGLKGVIGAYGSPGAGNAWAERNARRHAEKRAAEVITEDEAQWLIRRIGRDGVLHENEKALLAFIRAESPRIHPALEPLLKEVA